MPVLIFMGQAAWFVITVLAMVVTPVASIAWHIPKDVLMLGWMFYGMAMIWPTKPWESFSGMFMLIALLAMTGLAVAVQPLQLFVAGAWVVVCLYRLLIVTKLVR